MKQIHGINLIGLSGKRGHGKNTVANIIQSLTSKNTSNYAIFKNGMWKNIERISDWQQKSFANKLKQICGLLLNVTIDKLENEEYKNSTLWVHPNTGQNITPRYIMQQLGTEFGRSIHPNLWVDSLFVDFKKYKIEDENSEEYKLPNWIITDVRFLNEAKAIKDRNGLMIRVFRPGKLKVWFKDPDSGIESDEQDSSGYYWVQSINGDIWYLSQYKDDSGSQIKAFKHELIFDESDKHLSEVSLDNYEFDEVIINNGSIEDLIEKVKQILIKYKIL